MDKGFIFNDMIRYIGQTVTIFTESGGISGSGFTGTLACLDCHTLRLITQIGAAPSCPIGSSCCDCCNCQNSYGRCGNGNSNGDKRSLCKNRCYQNWLGSVTEIPVCKIVSFTHNSL